MKVVYNSKEIMNHTNDYNVLLNRPMINSHTLEGTVTLADINAYTKEQIDDLIGNSRSIEIVNALPTNLIENTLYYVGPDANDFYDVYLVDEVRNVFNIGTSQFGEYFAGAGVNIDNDNYISANIDNKTLIVDSEGNLHANLEMDSVPVMIGATSSAAGEKGLVPQPAIGTQNYGLTGSGVGKSIVNTLFPVGSVHLTIDNTNPGTFMPGTTGSKLSTGRAIGNDSTGGGGTINSGAPNINSDSGTTTRFLGHQQSSVGAMYGNRDSAWGSWNEGGHPYGQVEYNLSWSSNIYKDDQTTVQPPAIKICAGRRTA